MDQSQARTMLFVFAAEVVAASAVMALLWTGLLDLGDQTWLIKQVCALVALAGVAGLGLVFAMTGPARLRPVSAVLVVAVASLGLAALLWTRLLDVPDPQRIMLAAMSGAAGVVGLAVAVRRAQRVDE